MQRYKFILLLWGFSTLGCAASFEDQFKAYANKIKECRAIETSNVQYFPVTPWFASLQPDEQKRVILYLSIDNRDKCSRDERRALKALEHQLSPEQKQLFDNIGATAEPDHKKYIDGLDMNEIQNIQSAYSLPFNSLNVGKKLKLMK